MQISLGKRGPAMWFLGKPREIIVSLNAASPGPVEIDFEGLDELEQKKVLHSLRMGLIESDVDFQALYRRWAKSNPSVPADNIEDPRVKMQIEAAQRLQERRQKLEDKRSKEEEDRRNKCQHLVDQSVRAVKAALNGEKDVRFIRMLIQAERVGKARKGIINFLEEKLNKETVEKQAQISKKVSKAAEEQLKSNPAKETIPFTVIESEQETVMLTPEDLIMAAAEESVGGES